MTDRFIIVRVPGWVCDELDQLRDATEMQGHGEIPRSDTIAALIHMAARTDWVTADEDAHFDDTFAGSTLRAYRLDKIEREKAPL